MIVIPPRTILQDFANATGATLKVYTATDVLLGTVTLASPLGVLTEDSTHYIVTLSNSIPDAFADADGIASWGKITDGNSNVRMTFDITATGGGGDFTMPNTTVYIGGELFLTSAVFRVAKT